MKNFILLILLFFTLSCANHQYVLVKSDKPREEESLKVRVFIIFGLIPVYNNLDSENVCPNRKIRMLNMHDSALNGLVCGLTFAIICPHSVGVECVD